jgi:hypothetical protein
VIDQAFHNLIDEGVQVRVGLPCRDPLRKRLTVSL